MRRFAIIANVCTIIWGVLVFMKEGFPTGAELLVLIPLLFVPIINIWYLFLGKDLNEAKSFIMLFLKRKRLEEEMKIKIVQEKINKNS